MGLAITWTISADRDLGRTIEYLSSVNPPAASRLVRAVMKRIEALAANPELGREAVIGEHRVRVTTVAPFSIYYRVSTSHVVVLRLWDGRRDPADLSME